MQDPFAETKRKLVESFDALSPQLQAAAQYLLANPEDVGLNSMRTVAKAAGVTPATVSRLSRVLGFSHYEDLREPFRQRLRSASPGYSERLHDVQQRSDSTQHLLAELRNQDIENVKRALADDNYPALAQAVDVINASRRVYVLGLRGAYPAAFLFHYAYQLFRHNSQLLDTGAGIFADQLRDVGSQDCMLAISFPPYTQLTIDALEYASAAGVKVIAVTDGELSPAARAGAITITAAYDSPSFYQSFTGAVAVSQALITLIVSKTGDAALQMVKDSEKQLESIGAYWG